MCRQQASFCTHTHMHMNGKRVEKKIKKENFTRSCCSCEAQGTAEGQAKIIATTNYSHTEENSRANERSGMKPFD